VKTALVSFTLAGFGFVVYLLVEPFTGYQMAGIIAGVAIIGLLGLFISWTDSDEGGHQIDDSTGK